MLRTLMQSKQIEYSERGQGFTFLCEYVGISKIMQSR